MELSPIQSIPPLITFPQIGKPAPSWQVGDSQEQEYAAPGAETGRGKLPPTLAYLDCDSVHIYLEVSSRKNNVMCLTLK